MWAHRIDAITIKSGTAGGERRWYWLCVLSIEGEPSACRPCSAGDTLTWLAAWYAAKAHALAKHGVDLDAVRRG